VPRNLRGTLTFKICAHVNIHHDSTVHRSYTIAIFKHLEPFLPKNYIHIVIFTPNLQRALFYSKTIFLYYSTTTKLLPLTIFIEGCYLSLRASIQCWDVPVVVRKFMQGRHANQYLQPNRLPITASAEQPCTSHMVIRNNFEIDFCLRIKSALIGTCAIYYT
jgi:hypothetical protein